MNSQFLLMLLLREKSSLRVLKMGGDDGICRSDGWCLGWLVGQSVGVSISWLVGR